MILKILFLENIYDKIFGDKILFRQNCDSDFYKQSELCKCSSTKRYKIFNAGMKLSSFQDVIEYVISKS